MALESDPYATLGVHRDATSAQIARARRRLSREYHPDVNGDPDAAARIVEIQQAFELLSDPAARAEFDRTGRLPGRDRGPRGREAAPGIFVEPPAVDFGVLGPGEPGADAEVTVSWTGPPPTRIKSGPEGDWWTSLRAAMPDPSCVVFSLRARAAAGTADGSQQDQFTVTVDDTTVTVALTAEIRGMPPPPPPPVFEAAGHVPAPRGRAPGGRRGAAGPAILALITLGFTVMMTVLLHNSGGSTGVLSAPTTPTTPPVRPVKVPQTRTAALAVRPVFRESAQLTSGPPSVLADPPTQRGSELLLSPYPLVGADPTLPVCVDVTVPDADEGPAAGLTFMESPLGTVTLRGTKEVAYPAVIPGTYTLDAGCDPADNTGANTGNPLVLGSVTIPNLGVGTGLINNAMVVLAAHTTGDVTTVSYAAMGNNNNLSRRRHDGRRDLLAARPRPGQPAGERRAGMAKHRDARLPRQPRAKPAGLFRL
jgi:hypothetical protein